MSVSGALIMAFFATVWWVVGLRAAGHGPAVLFPVPLLVAAALAGAAWYGVRRRDAARLDVEDAEEARRGRLVGWASAGEGVAIFIAANVLVNTGHPHALAPVMALIVGAHFIPLAHGLPAPAYYGTAAALGALGLAGLAISDVPMRLTVVSAGAAVVLWLTAASAVYRASQPSTSESHFPAA